MPQTCCQTILIQTVSIKQRIFWGSSYVCSTTPGPGSTGVKRRGTPYGVYSPVQKTFSSYTNTVQKILVCKYWGSESLITRGSNSI